MEASGEQSVVSGAEIKKNRICRNCGIVLNVSADEMLMHVAVCRAATGPKRKAPAERRDSGVLGFIQEHNASAFKRFVIKRSRRKL